MPAAGSRGGLGINVKASTNLFFDRAAVLSQMDQKTAKALNRAGAMVRTIARRSIRDGSKKTRHLPSNPGQPPKNRTGLLKDFIFYVYLDRSVIIGAAKLNQTLGTAPNALEHGGISLTNRGSRKKKRIVEVRIKARPFMSPALDKAIPKLPGFWGFNNSSGLAAG